MNTALKNILELIDHLKVRLLAARPLMNLYLLSRSYTITSLKADNEAKQVYYTALEQSHVDNNHEPFNLLVANAVKQSLEKYLGIIEG